MTLRMSGLTVAKPTPLRVQLCEGELASLGLTDEGVGIELREGRAWITQEGDPRDYVLHSGEAFHTSRRGRVVIQALDETSLVMLP